MSVVNSFWSMRFTDGSLSNGGVRSPARYTKPGSSLITHASLGSAYPVEVGADRVWSSGGTGAGVTVAVLDSGIANDPDLGNRIVARVNLADALDGPSTDRYIH